VATPIIFLIDDHTSVRDALGEMLSVLGYSIIPHNYRSITTPSYRAARAAVMGWLIRPPTRPAKTVVLLSDPFPLSVIQDAGQCPSECMSSLMSLVIEISDKYLSSIYLVVWLNFQKKRM
jgi:hypothetical protein